MLKTPKFTWKPKLFFWATSPKSNLFSRHFYLCVTQTSQTSRPEPKSWLRTSSFLSCFFPFLKKSSLQHLSKWHPVHPGIQSKTLNIIFVPPSTSPRPVVLISQMKGQSFYNLISEVTYHCFCCVLFIRSESLNPDHTQGKGITKGHSTFGDYLRGCQNTPPLFGQRSQPCQELLSLHCHMA